jgi:hypothetical protein
LSDTLLGVESFDAAGCADLRKLLEDPRRDAAALELVGDRERNLRDRRLTQPVVATRRYDPVSTPPDQHNASVAVGLRVRASRPLGPHVAMEALVPAVLRQLVVEGLDCVEIIGRGRTQPQRSAVLQHHVSD